jgi:ribosome assembly protein RRB1
MEAEIADVVEELPKSTGIWNDQAEPLKDDEELEFDSSAYEMLHRSAVEWPCLSIDIIVRERAGGPTGILSQKSWFPSQCGGVLSDQDSVFDKRLNLSKHRADNYPMTAYFVGGSQSEDKSQNKLYVMKWSGMEMTLNDDKPVEENSSDDEEDMIEKMNN